MTRLRNGKLCIRYKKFPCKKQTLVSKENMDKIIFVAQ